MTDVSSKYLSILLLSMAFLTGCESPDLQVASLGKKLPAPVLKGQSPFDQEFEPHNYVRLQGSCDTRILSLLIQFNDHGWARPPAIPDTTDTALPSDVVNDIDCSDGFFDIFITKNDLLNIWQINPQGDDGDDVTFLYVKGETLIGDTEVLTLIDEHHDDDDDYGGPAAIIALEKNHPKGFAGSNRCESMRVILKTANGYESTHESDVNFSLVNVSNEIVSAYATWDDCNNDSNEKTNFVIPAGERGIDIIYRFPSAGALTLNVASSSFSSPSMGESITVRNPASDYRWLAMDNNGSQIYKDSCYPITVRAYKYDGSSDYSNADTLMLTANNSNFKIYSDVSCTSVTNVKTLSAGAMTLYAKYISTGMETESYKNISISAQKTSDNSNNIYDATTFNIRVDVTNKSSISKMDIWGPKDLVRNSCQSFQVIFMNDNWTRIPTTTTTLINLNTLEPSIGVFYNTSTCTTPVTSLAVGAGQDSATVYFKPTTNIEETYHFNISSAFASNATREFKVKVLPTNLVLNDPTGNLSSPVQTCTPLEVGLRDPVYQPVPAQGSGVIVNLSLALGGSLTSGKLFMDAGCSTPLSGDFISIPPGYSDKIFYVNKLGYYAGTFLELSAQSSGLLGITLTTTLIGGP